MGKKIQLIMDKSKTQPRRREPDFVRTSLRSRQIIIWALAIIVIFAVATIFGWRIFYGYVVPQTNNLTTFSFIGLFAFAALAGIMVNFGPCSLAVLPAYLGFYLSQEDRKKKPVLRAIKLGSIAALGVFIFYLLLGVVLSGVGVTAAQYAPRLKLVVAVIILILGIMLLRGKELRFGFISQFKDSVIQASQSKNSKLGLLGFGIIYGAGGLSCFLPIFLPLVFFPFVKGQFGESLISFIIFALFQALFLIGATVAVALGKQSLLRKMMGKTEMVKKIAGAILILTSFYMFSIFLILGM